MTDIFKEMLERQKQESEKGVDVEKVRVLDEAKFKNGEVPPETYDQYAEKARKTLEWAIKERQGFMISVEMPEGKNCISMVVDLNPLQVANHVAAHIHNDENVFALIAKHILEDSGFDFEEGE